MLATIDPDALGHVTGGAASSCATMLLMAMLLRCKPGGMQLDGDKKAKLFDLFKGMLEKSGPKPADPGKAK